MCIYFLWIAILYYNLYRDRLDVKNKNLIFDIDRFIGRNFYKLH